MNDFQINALLALDAKRNLDQAADAVKALDNFCCDVMLVFADIVHGSGTYIYSFCHEHSTLSVCTLSLRSCVRAHLRLENYFRKIEIQGSIGTLADFPTDVVSFTNMFRWCWLLKVLRSSKGKSSLSLLRKLAQSSGKKLLRSWRVRNGAAITTRGARTMRHALGKAVLPADFGPRNDI